MIKKLANKENIDILFYPSDKMIFSKNHQTTVSNKYLSRELCGKGRAGHFDGVCTIVTKLLNIVQPNSIYLGQKDAQQVLIIKQLINDLNYSIKIRTSQTVRDLDGLALSSRNKNLTELERAEAKEIFKILKFAKKKIKEGESDPLRLLRLIKNSFNKLVTANVDYVHCLNA